MSCWLSVVMYSANLYSMYDGWDERHTWRVVTFDGLNFRGLDKFVCLHLLWYSLIILMQCIFIKFSIDKEAHKIHKNLNPWKLILMVERYSHPSGLQPCSVLAPTYPVCSSVALAIAPAHGRGDWAPLRLLLHTTHLPRVCWASSW